MSGDITERKIRLLQGHNPYFDDELAELLADKLSLEDIQKITKYGKAAEIEIKQRYAQYILSRPTLKERMKLLEAEAKENE